MTEWGMPPAVNGQEMRLDALIALQKELIALLTPAATPESDTLELREPEADNLHAPLTGIKVNRSPGDPKARRAR